MSREARFADTGFGTGGQIRPLEFTRTETQIKPFEGFRTGEVAPREPHSLKVGESPTLRLATPPRWAQRDDLPCLGRWEEYDNAGRKDGDPERAAQLCRVGQEDECPVRLACLSAALEEELGEDGRPLAWQYRHGIRGGTTPGQRYRLGNTLVTEAESATGA